MISSTRGGQNRLTTSDFKDWLSNHRADIQILGEYLTNSTKTMFGCTSGHQWSAKPNDIKTGRGCPHCAGNIKKSTAEFSQWLSANRPEIKLIGEYSSGKVKTTFECGSGHQWLAQPRNVKNCGSGCPECKRLNDSWTESDLVGWLATNRPSVKLIGHYTDNETKTLFEGDCGHQWLSTPHNVKGGGSCRQCSIQNQAITQSKFVEWLNLSRPDIMMVGDWIAYQETATFVCEGGHHWRVSPMKVKGGRHCPQCMPTTSGFDPLKPAWAYVFKRSTYIKYGITNRLDGRLAKHRTHGEFDLVYLHHFDIGSHARQWEDDIKQKCGGRYVGRDICPDGWTETLPLSMLPWLTGDRQNSIDASQYYTAIDRVSGKKPSGFGDIVSKNVTGNISINKDGVERRVKDHHLNEWLDKGWALGGLPRKKKQT